MHATQDMAPPHCIWFRFPPPFDSFSDSSVTCYGARQLRVFEHFATKHPIVIKTFSWAEAEVSPENEATQTFSMDPLSVDSLNIASVFSLPERIWFMMLYSSRATTCSLSAFLSCFCWRSRRCHSAFVVFAYYKCSKSGPDGFAFSISFPSGPMSALSNIHVRWRWVAATLHVCRCLKQQIRNLNGRNPEGHMIGSNSSSANPVIAI